MNPCRWQYQLWWVYYYAGEQTPIAGGQEVKPQHSKVKTILQDWDQIIKLGYCKIEIN